MSSLPLRLRLLLLAAAIFGFLALASFGESLAQAPVASLGLHAAETAALPHPSHPAASTLSARLQDGTYTFDGLVAGLHLNYEVQDAKYMYLFVPGLGTAVVSATPSADALETPVVLTGSELSFRTGGHEFRLSGITFTAAENSEPVRLYVHLDAAAWRLGRRAMIGFGMTAQRPYAWPSALANAQPETLGAALPVPSTLMPGSSNTHPLAPAPSHIVPVALHPSAVR